MQLDEAVQIQQYVLKGMPVQPAKLKEAMRVVRASMHVNERRKGTPEPLSTAQRERINLVLIAKLAIACGKLAAWQKPAALPNLAAAPTLHRARRRA